MTIRAELDTANKIEWDKSYQIPKSPNLWGSEPVPFVHRAIEVLRARGSEISVIDIPCGEARNTVPLARAFSIVIGADASPTALQISSRVLASHNIRNCILMEGDVFNLKFANDQFDGVFCWDLLGHLTSPAPALIEALRVCKPGGYVIGSVFATGDSTRGQDMRAIGNEEYLYAETFYYKFYEREDVSALLMSLTCHIVSVELTSWIESPHEGFREYPHEHQSWAFTIQKT